MKNIDEKLFVTFVLFYEMLYDVFLLERCSSKFGVVLLLLMMMMVEALLLLCLIELKIRSSLLSSHFKLGTLSTLKRL